MVMRGHTTHILSNVQLNHSKKFSTSSTCLWFTINTKQTSLVCFHPLCCLLLLPSKSLSSCQRPFNKHLLLPYKIGVCACVCVHVSVFRLCRLSSKKGPLSPLKFSLLHVFFCLFWPSSVFTHALSLFLSLICLSVSLSPLICLSVCLSRSLPWSVCLSRSRLSWFDTGELKQGHVF